MAFRPISRGDAETTNEWGNTGTRRRLYAPEAYVAGVRVVEFESLSTVDLKAWKRKGYLGNPGKGSRRRYTGV